MPDTIMILPRLFSLSLLILVLPFCTNWSRLPCTTNQEATKSKNTPIVNSVTTTGKPSRVILLFFTDKT